jgi:hypothetical protein
MLEKLKNISPVLILILLLLQGYLIWALYEAREESERAHFMALQAANAAGNAAANAKNATATARQVKTQLLSISSACVRCSGGSGTTVQKQYRTLTYTTTYHEFLLEDLALKSGLDLARIRKDFKKLARKSGVTRPRGWTWARSAE